ncbi:hypothetical protein BKI52_29395 [marine bacterium AO1-C]|nr:hypothetical protein BKI52_29395 [marine bacterium AO1-C]
MKKSIWCIFIIFLVASTSLTYAQNKSVLHQTFTVQQLQEDFQRMREQLEKNQPGLYKYTPKPAMDHYLDSLYATINKPMSSLEFLHLIRPILIKMRNGHNNVYGSKEMADYARNKGKFLPLEVVWLKDGFYVKAVYDNKASLPKGSKIVSINGRDIQDILQKLLQYTSTDGYNETFPRRRIARSFPFAYYWYISQTSTFRVSYKAMGQTTTQTATLTGVSFRPLRDQMNKERGNDPKAKMLQFKMLNNETAFLRVESFSKGEIKNGKQKYKRFLKNTFATIAQKKVKNLILDVRSNGGGDDGYGNLLFSYLTDRPFNYYKNIVTRVKRIKNPKYYENTGEIRLANLFFGGKVRKVAEGKYHLKKNPGLGQFQPQANAFTGNLYILIDGGCFSATGEFASCAHYNKRGKFIGEEVGGNYYANTSGAMLSLVLPNTKHRVIVTILQYVMDVKGYPKGRGVMPDYPVDYTIQDVLQKNDLVMQKALKLIDEQGDTPKK